MQQIKLKKWGNSQGIRLPKSILTEAQVKPDDTFIVRIDKNKNIILEKKKKPQNLKELFDGFDYKKYWADWEKEHPNESREIDWGEPQGREIF